MRRAGLCSALSNLSGEPVQTTDHTVPEIAMPSASSANARRSRRRPGPYHGPRLAGKDVARLARRRCFFVCDAPGHTLPPVRTRHVPSMLTWPAEGHRILHRILHDLCSRRRRSNLLPALRARRNDKPGLPLDSASGFDLRYMRDGCARDQRRAPFSASLELEASEACRSPQPDHALQPIRARRADVTVLRALTKSKSRTTTCQEKIARNCHCNLNPPSSTRHCAKRREETLPTFLSMS